MATAQEIENWKAFLHLLASANVIKLLEVSDHPHNNESNSQCQRTYIEAELKVDVNSVKHRFEVRLTDREDA
ncbi:hypothetical protein VB834_19505 [Limnoraphis robusta Tam1]|nr:hypothetical protein [Limnoraphis robusta]MEA5501456.1 hypothetical protein [Limnoraphis robusta BA-68 BA1]MEA5541216.1 hypothetical protein [Limnoraphis robusta Tam1]